MTTATTFDNANNTISNYDYQQATPFGYGAGHINPNAPANPGLIYELTENDYLEYLCTIYTEKDLRVFTATFYKCKGLKSVLDFNYPSITETKFSASATVSRTVTNVGKFGTYVANVTAPNGVQISVNPWKLEFNMTGEKRTYSVELKSVGGKGLKSEYVFGSLVWSDGIHYVRNPIVIERV